MARTLTLTAADGHSLGAYRADASGGAACGGLVVLQEIFGVNLHLREVCRQLRGGWIHLHRARALRPLVAEELRARIRGE